MRKGEEGIMRGFKIFLLLFCFGVGFFCCKKSAEDAYPIITEIIDNVQVVQNPNYPRDGIIQDILEEELSIGLDEGPEEYMLNRPFDVDVDVDGAIYILDWGDVNIKVYDKEGIYLRTIGQKGQGPGDFGFLLYMALSSDGRIFVMNTVNRQVSVFSVSGEYQGGFSFEGSQNEMRTDGENRIYYSKHTQKTSEGELPITKDLIEIESIVQIFRNEADGEDLYLLGDFEGEIDRMRKTETGVLTIGSEFNIVWNVSREGLLYEGLNQEYKINVFDQNGKKMLTFGREYESVIQEYGPEDNRRKRAMPAFDPRIGWRFDDEGNLWVSIYSQNEGEVIYDVFSPEGIYMKQVILPCRICEIKKGKIYSIVTSEEGYMTVKRFSLKDFEL